MCVFSPSLSLSCCCFAAGAVFAVNIVDIMTACHVHVLVSCSAFCSMGLAPSLLNPVMYEVDELVQLWQDLLVLYMFDYVCVT